VRILFLSQRVPYPPNRGDKITTWRLVERMKRTHEVQCIAFAHDDADVAAGRELDAKGIPTVAVRYRDTWKKITSLPLLLTSTPLTLGVYGSRELQAAVDRAMPSCDMAYAYSSSMGAFLEKHASKPRVMHFGELDSDKWRQYAARTSFPMSRIYAREHRTLLEFERRVARAFAENVLCTPIEQEIFRAQIPGASSTVLRNGVDLGHFKPPNTEPEAAHIVFTGVMNYYPNADGCIWFVREILPRIRKEFPSARFSIVGAHPSPAVNALASTSGVVVTGFVKDTRDWLAKAAVAVAPLRIARGIQNKVLEAMAMGLPLVGTTPATQGVEARHEREYLVADDAAAFADAVCRLLRDRVRASELGRAARAFVEAHYDWEVVFRHLDDILERCEQSAARR
jgi:sugar transferase (PEP-CTERM/EpsH1 system associated)